MIEQQQDKLYYLQFSHFSQFSAVIHGIFTRQGGHSSAPFESLNTSLSIGDTFENVIRNRLLVLQSLGIENYPCATLWQVHGDTVVSPDTTPWEDWQQDWAHRSYAIGQDELVWTTKPRKKADAVITKQRGVALALSFADCVPILFYDPVEEVIGMAHGGWRGTARGIAIATVEAMAEQFGSQPEHIYAGIGTSIGPCCYEVSEQVQRLFSGEEQFQDAPVPEKRRALVQRSAVFSHKELADRTSLRLNLWETNRNQLLLAGLRPEHIEVQGLCTSCNKDSFYSHRAELGKTGRFPVILALAE